MTKRYNERSATIYNRAHTITINNPHRSTGLNPSIHFYEQFVAVNPDGSTDAMPETVGQADLDGEPADYATMQVPMFDLATQKATGKTFTMQEFASMVFSLYFYATEKRDQEQAELDAAQADIPEGAKLGPFDAGMPRPEEDC